MHVPHVKSGKRGFIDYFKRMAREYPGKEVNVKRIVAEDNLVILHCHQIWPDNLEYAGTDIFRFDGDGKIVEHRDVLQTLLAESKNDNSIFFSREF